MYSRRRKAHNGDAVIVNMGYFMEFFLDLSVLALWPDEAIGSARTPSDTDGTKEET